MQIAEKIREVMAQVVTPVDNRFEGTRRVLELVLGVVTEAETHTEPLSRDAAEDLRAVSDEAATLANTSVPIINVKRHTKSAVPASTEYILRKLIQHVAGMVVDVIATRPPKDVGPPPPASVPEPKATAQEDTDEHVVPPALQEVQQAMEEVPDVEKNVEDEEAPDEDDDGPKKRKRGKKTT